MSDFFEQNTVRGVSTIPGVNVKLSEKKIFKKPINHENKLSKPFQECSNTQMLEKREPFDENKFIVLAVGTSEVEQLLSLLYSYLKNDLPNEFTVEVCQVPHTHDVLCDVFRGPKHAEIRFEFFEGENENLGLMCKNLSDDTIIAVDVWKQIKLKFQEEGLWINPEEDEEDVDSPVNFNGLLSRPGMNNKCQYLNISEDESIVQEWIDDMESSFYAYTILLFAWNCQSAENLKVFSSFQQKLFDAMISLLQNDQSLVVVRSVSEALKFMLNDENPVDVSLEQYKVLSNALTAWCGFKQPSQDAPRVRSEQVMENLTGTLNQLCTQIQDCPMEVLHLPQQRTVHILVQ